MDFIVGLPLTARKFDSIWVIMDRLSKSAHFIPIHTNYNIQKYAGIYIARVLCLHRVLKVIISDWGSQFGAHFWEQLHASLGAHLIHSSAYHPQTVGQTERVNKILEDMLRACVLEHQGSWDQNLSKAEFSYNNSYQESLKMAPFEVLYGCRCRTPLNWIESWEKVIFGLDLVEEAEPTVRRIQENLKVVNSHQETYVNRRRRPLEFEDGDHVYLRVSSMKGVTRFGWKEN
jgi:transposase InsO family protein